VASNPLRPVNGYIELPAGPGLGLDVLEAGVRAHPGKSYAPRTFRHSEDATGPGAE
jgi:galactonate dehydratase